MLSTSRRVLNGRWQGWQQREAEDHGRGACEMMELLEDYRFGFKNQTLKTPKSRFGLWAAIGGRNEPNNDGEGVDKPAVLG